jgi:hypothetical protein
LSLTGGYSRLGLMAGRYDNPIPCIVDYIPVREEFDIWMYAVIIKNRLNLGFYTWSEDNKLLYYLSTVLKTKN